MGNSFLIVVLPLYIASESIKGELPGHYAVRFGYVTPFIVGAALA
jgi:hypothetical protein